MFDWKERFKNKMFWLAIIPAVLLVLYILIWDKEFLSDKKPESGGKTGAPEGKNDASDG